MSQYALQSPTLTTEGVTFWVLVNPDSTIIPYEYTGWKDECNSWHETAYIGTAISDTIFAYDTLGNAMEKWPDRDIMDLEGNEIYNVRGAVALGVDWDGNNITGFPEDIANAILYLISDEAHYVNGAQLNVDGGWTSF